jgi:hypothetical protein
MILPYRLIIASQSLQGGFFGGFGLHDPPAPPLPEALELAERSPPVPDGVEGGV